jgi:predicted TIM-barrel enzyme
MKKLPTLVGVIHLPPLPGAPRAGEAPSVALRKARDWATREARILTEAGFEGLIIENFADTPFYKDCVPPESCASMAVVASAVREVTSLPIGVNVLRNDGRTALAVASVTGCDFIRVNVLNGIAATDQGMIEGQADAHVKHAKTLSSDDIEIAVEEVALRGMADAVIITGQTTGRVASDDHLRKASEAARKHGIRLYIGSGSTPQNLARIRPLVHGIIVGSAIRKEGLAGAPLDSTRVRSFVRAFKKGAE